MEQLTNDYKLYQSKFKNLTDIYNEIEETAENKYNV